MAKKEKEVKEVVKVFVPSAVKKEDREVEASQLDNISKE